MNGRERVSAILKKQVPDKMGLFDHLWPETIRDYWSKEGYPENTEPQTYFNWDMVFCANFFNTEPFFDRVEIVEETDQWRITKNGRGATLKLWKNHSGTPEHVGFEVTTPEIWKPYREQLLSIDERRLGDVNDILAKMKIARSQGRFALIGNLFIFELLRATLGDENFLPALMLEPEWIKDFCKVYTDFFIRHYQLLFDKIGLPDGFFLYEDFGYSNGLFCSPDCLRELIMPYEKQFVNFLKDHKLPVLLHTCGNINKAMPLIIDAGFDCLQPMEAKAGMNVVALAKTYGSKISYMGNIDVTVLNTNDRALIKDEIVTKMNALKQMRIPYVFHSDHSIPPTVKLDTYKYMLELYQAHSKY